MEKTNRAYAILIGLPEIQRLNLRLMELASFNEFDGPRVVLSLLSNKDLWQACLMDRESFWDAQTVNERRSSLSICLIKLRDMSDETMARLGRQCWNVDTSISFQWMTNELKFASINWLRPGKLMKLTG